MNYVYRLESHDIQSGPFWTLNKIHLPSVTSWGEERNLFVNHKVKYLNRIHMLLSHTNFSLTQPSSHLHLSRYSLHGLFMVYSYEIWKTCGCIIITGDEVRKFITNFKPHILNISPCTFKAENNAVFCTFSLKKNSNKNPGWQDSSVSKGACN